MDVGQHMPDMDELPNQFSVEITRTDKNMMISQIDLHYAYGQMKRSEETSQQIVLALSGGKRSLIRLFLGLAIFRMLFQEKIDRTLECYTQQWLDDMIVVIRAGRKEHEKKVLDVLKKKMLDAEPMERIPNCSQKNHKLKSSLYAVQQLAKTLIRLSESINSLQKRLRKNQILNWGKREEDFN